MKKRIPYIIISLIILSIAWYDILIVINDGIIPFGNIITQLAILIVSLLPALIKRMPYFIKIAVPIVILLVFCSVAGFELTYDLYNVFITYSDEQAVEIHKEDNAYTIYGEYKTAELYIYQTPGFFHPYETDTLILQFDDEEFIQATKKINEYYDFHDAPIKPSEPVPEFNLQGFDFRLQIIDKTYPYVMHFIGINEATKEIAYVYTCNLDQDTVSNYEEHLLYCCGWKYIELHNDGKILGNIVFD